MTEQARGELLLLIAPFLDQLERSGLNLDQQQVIQVLRQKLNGNAQRSDLLMLENLTPAEREVTKGIQKNLPSKLIADNLNIEKSTVDFHRRNIRQKLNLVHSRTSLKHYFQNLSVDI